MEAHHQPARMSAERPGNVTQSPSTTPRQYRITKEDRRRATRACDRCRRLKEKCEGGVPCNRCKHSQRLCEFKTVAAQVQDSSRWSESARATYGEINLEELEERLRLMESIIRSKFGGISQDTKSLARLAESLSAGNISTGQAVISPVEDTDDDEDLAIEEEFCTIDPVEETTTHYSGEFSYWNFSMRIKRHIDSQMSGSDIRSARVANDVPNYWRAEQLKAGSGYLTTAIASRPPRDVADFLCKVFFNCEERHSFAVDQSWLHEVLESLHNDPAGFTSKGAATISIILTVLAIGTQYAYLDSPKQSRTLRTAAAFSEDEIGAVWYQHAIRLLPEIIESSSLESVQACLLFGIYALPIDASGLGYIYLNLSIRLAIQNGMHRKYSGELLTPTMLDLRNRVWWLAYTLERKISIFHGRPLSTHRADVDADLPREIQEPHLAESTSEVSYMVASIHMTSLLEDCYAIMTRLRNHQKHQLHNVLGDLLSLKSMLVTWYLGLPEDVRALGATQFSHFNRRAAIHLGLEYCSIRMFIGRPFLFSRVSTNTGSTYSSPESRDERMAAPSSSSCTSPTSKAALVSRQADLVDDCVLAASEALGLLQTLRGTETGLARASYIEYSSCRATLLVLIAHSLQHQSTRTQKLLQDGLDMIRDMASGWDSAQSEVGLIEALEKALTRLHEQVKEKGGIPYPEEKSEYDSFKDWGASWKSGSIPSSAHAPATEQLLHLSEPQQHTAIPREFRTDVQQARGSRPVYAGSSSHSGFQQPILGRESNQMSSNWSAWPESQIFDNFMALPQYVLDGTIDIDAMFGSMDP